jgi:hypothetical protein
MQEQIDKMHMDMVDSKNQIADLAKTVNAHLEFQRQSQAETVITPEQIKCNTCKN